MYLRLPLRSRTYLTYFLLGLLGVVFVAQFALEQLLGFDVVINLGAKFGPAIARGQVWRLVTAIFIHAGLLHFLFNVYALYYLGHEVEAIAGTLRMGLIFLYAGLAGTVFSLLFTPAPSVGASGAIFGLIGALGVFLYRNRRLFGAGGRRRLQSVVFIAGINLLIGLQGGIDNWAHLGGLLGGLALAWAIGPVWAVHWDPLQSDTAVAQELALPPVRWALAAVLVLALAGLAVLAIARAVVAL